MPSDRGQRGHLYRFSSHGFPDVLRSKAGQLNGSGALQTKLSTTRGDYMTSLGGGESSLFSSLRRRIAKKYRKTLRRLRYGSLSSEDGAVARRNQHDYELLKRYYRRSRPQAGYVIDFVGSRTDVRFNAQPKLSGHVGKLPRPGNLNAEAVEWIGVLKAVDSARDTFTVAELGAG